MVEATFSGEYEVKGKPERQRLYRLEALRQGAARFDAAVSRGLGAFVGREGELERLNVVLRKPTCNSVLSISWENPEWANRASSTSFARTIGKQRAPILSGSCSPEGRQTSFLPLIEVLRGSFQIGVGEAETDVAQKSRCIDTLGLHSSRNLGLLHLLGLEVPDGALSGLDGVLIGLRTRELLRQLLEARCRLSPVIMILEDLHWIDSVSEEVLDNIVGRQDNQQLLILHTRRPEYKPPWLGRTAVSTINLEPLTADDICRLVRTRPGAAALPDALARGVAEKAEGNPLFAEEILSFLIERGVLRVAAGKVEFDSKVVAATLPATVESLLTARVDSLAAAEDRRFLANRLCHWQAILTLVCWRPHLLRPTTLVPASQRCRQSISSVWRGIRIAIRSSTPSTGRDLSKPAHGSSHSNPSKDRRGD